MAEWACNLYLSGLLPSKVMGMLVHPYGCFCEPASWIWLGWCQGVYTIRGVEVSDPEGVAMAKPNHNPLGRPVRYGITLC